MAAGMWQGLLAGYKSVEEKKAAREEKEEEIARRRRTIANALRPSMQKNLEMVEEQRSMLTYLEGRGLPKETINALYQDPETLKGAFQFARDGKGVDLTPEQLTDIFRVTQLGEEAPGDAYTALQSSAELYSSLDTAEDLDAFQELLYQPRARTAVVATVFPEEPKEKGVSSTQDRTWGLQAQAYDRTLLAIARAEREVLMQKDDKGQATAEDINKLTELTEDIDKYGSNEGQANTERLRGSYGSRAIELIESSENISPDLLAGFNNNPLIFDFGEAAKQSVLDSLGPEFKGGILVGKGVDPADGRNTKFYTMPDGSTETVKE
jgi:hypothetical protein